MTAVNTLIVRGTKYQLSGRSAPTGQYLLQNAYPVSRPTDAFHNIHTRLLFVHSYMVPLRLKHDTVVQLLLRRILILNRSRMLMPRRQHPPHIKLPDIDSLELLALLPDTAVQRLDRRIRVGSQEERKRVSPLARHVAYAVDGGGEKSVRMAFEVLADVADEGAGDGRGGDPEPVCV